MKRSLALLGLLALALPVPASGQTFNPALVTVSFAADRQNYAPGDVATITATLSNGNPPSVPDQAILVTASLHYIDPSGAAQVVTPVPLILHTASFYSKVSGASLVFTVPPSAAPQTVQFPDCDGGKSVTQTLTVKVQPAAVPATLPVLSLPGGVSPGT